MPAETLVHLLRDNYTEAKVRGKKSFLLERQQLYSLAEFRSQTEILGFLADGPYGLELSKLQESSSPVEVERAVRLSFARSLRNLISTAKGSVKRFLVEYTRRFEAYDLAALVLFRSQEKPWEEYAATRLPLGVMNERELHKLYSVEDLETLASEVGGEKLQERLEGIELEGLTTDKASLVRDIFNGWGEELQRMGGRTILRFHQQGTWRARQGELPSNSRIIYRPPQSHDNPPVEADRHLRYSRASRTGPLETSRQRYQLLGSI